MPNKLQITNRQRARRHVVSQQLYRLRKRYKFMQESGPVISAARIRSKIRRLESEYNQIGGQPNHPGNQL